MAKIGYTKLFLEEENSAENYFHGFVVSKTRLEFSTREVRAERHFRLRFFLYSAKEVDRRSNEFLNVYRVNLIGKQ
ncbi:MAG: hypothetical protein QM485_06825 [Flavobacteriaceae bacterium]